MAFTTDSMSVTSEEDGEKRKTIGHQKQYTGQSNKQLAHHGSSGPQKIPANRNGAYVGSVQEADTISGSIQCTTVNGSMEDIPNLMVENSVYNSPWCNKY